MHVSARQYMLDIRRQIRQLHEKAKSLKSRHQNLDAAQAPPLQ